MALKIHSLKKKGETVTFDLEGASMAFANALRRVMIAEIPILAVEWAEFHENSSALYDEIVAHRLGLIPLKFEADQFRFTADCTCEGEGCPQCQVVFAVEKTGPCIVSSGDMKSSNKAVKPASPDFPIVELLRGQSIKFEAVARLGIGQQHAKFQAANTVYAYEEEEGKTKSVAKEKNAVFHFTVESISGLDPETIVAKAADVLEAKAQNFKRRLLLR